MKITFLLHELPLRQVGGVLSNIELMNHLQDIGHECRIIYPKFPIYYKPFSYGVDRVKSQTLRFYRYMTRKEYPDHFKNVPAYAIPYIAPQYLPVSDLLLISWWELAYQIKDYPKAIGKKINIVRGHENHIEGLGKNLAGIINGSYKLPGYDLIAISPHLKEVVEQESGKEIYGPIPNGINFKDFYPNEHERNDVFKIGMICRHLPVKGFQDGLKALAILRDNDRFDFTLSVVGEDPWKGDGKLHNRFPSIEYWGYIPRPELCHWYHSLDAFLWPSREEGFGNPPLEAMACGCPVVATRTGAMKTHVIGGKHALLTDPGDVEKMAGYLEMLIDWEGYRRIMARRALENVQQYSWEKVAKEYEKVFEEVLNES